MGGLHEFIVASSTVLWYLAFIRSCVHLCQNKTTPEILIHGAGIDIHANGCGVPTREGTNNEINLRK